MTPYNGPNLPFSSSLYILLNYPLDTISESALYALALRPALSKPWHITRTINLKPLTRGDGI